MGNYLNCMLGRWRFGASDFETMWSEEMGDGYPLNIQNNFILNNNISELMYSAVIFASLVTWYMMSL